MSSDDFPPEAEATLPPPSDDMTTEVDFGSAEDDGESTMDEVPAGLLGSTDAYRQALRESQMGMTRAASSGEGRPSSSDTKSYVEAELVQSSAHRPTVKLSDTSEALDIDEETLISDSSEETLSMGSETLAELKAQGNRVLGDFELERKVGQGGMGEVWLARQISLDRPVAVKVLPRSLATQENFIERFQREAKAAASLVHPNVIQIYAYGIDEGTPYFAMEYVEGEDLQQRMRRTQLEWGEIVDIMVGVGSALHAAHAKGLIHRDIKPSNIMIDKTGLVKVMDFGLAKATSGGDQAKSLTSAGLIMGTPNYLSPEQGRGDPLDGRSDLYSLGIVLYELLTGSLPFRADTPAGLIFKHVYEPPPPPGEVNPDIPPFLVEIVLKLLEKDPDDRYKAAQEFAADLAEFIDNYDHYVTEGGERRPGAGYLDANRLKGSGSFSTSGTSKRRVSDRRSAVTEEVTKANLPAKSAVAPEPPPGRPERAEIDKPKAPSVRPSQRYVKPPKKKSKVPAIAFVVLLLAGGGLGYAYKYHNAEFMRALQQAGLDFRRKPVNGGNSSGGPIVVTGGDTVAFLYDGLWPERTQVVLARPSIGKVILERGKQQPMPLGEYELRFTRGGYEPYSLPVKLVDEGGRGKLANVDEGPLSIEPQWVPTRELREAYAKGKAALEEGKLSAAREAIERAAAFDPDYRPPDVGADQQLTVAELRAKLDAQLSDEQLSEGRLADLTRRSQKLVEEKRWKLARQNLLSTDQEERTDVINQLIERCNENLDNGAHLKAAISDSIERGDFSSAAPNLEKLTADYPELDEDGTLAKKLEKASAFREDALSLGVDQDLVEAKTKLQAYLELFGPNDKEAKVRLDEIEQLIAAAQELRGRETALRELAEAGEWKQARSKALELLEIDPENAAGQEIRGRAEEALAKQDILETVAELDAALVERDYDAVVRLLNPASGSYARERQAFLDLPKISGRFHSSKHLHPEVSLATSDTAEVSAEWTFELEALGEPRRELSAQHKIRLRRIEKRWLVTEVHVDGGVRVRR